MKLVTTDQMRALEADAVSRGISIQQLMKRAGSGIAAEVRERLDGASALILVGPGNNGSDGLVAALELRQEGRNVEVYTFRRTDMMGFEGTIHSSESDVDWALLDEAVKRSHVVVDALLGIGSSRPPDGKLSEILHCVNEGRAPSSFAIAIDIPTGVDPDSGGVATKAFRAELTLAMGFAKLGVVVHPGAEYAGQVRTIDIGIPKDVTKYFAASAPDDGELASLLPLRTPQSNKGSAGHLLIVGGSQSYTGAPALASMAAYRAGAGLVEVAAPEEVQHSVASHVPEVIFCVTPSTDGQLTPDSMPALLRSLPRAKAIVFGPGLGHSDATVELTREFLAAVASSRAASVLIDADGLNALATMDNWWTTPFESILTPHPGEMARLTGLSIQEIQSDRIRIARESAETWSRVVVLKGARTVVAAPDGRVSVVTTGGANLATAGTGDVLSGTIGAMLVQGLGCFEAATLGAYLHGRAGDLLAGRLGDVGTVASDLPDYLPIARLSILGHSGEQK